MHERTTYVRLNGIKLIATVNGIAALLHVLFWVTAFMRLPDLSLQETGMYKINLATTYGFGIADLIWSFPLLLIGSIALWQKKFTGWLAAYLTNVLYWYSLTVIIVRDLSSQTIAPGTILFLPFALFAFWTAYYLWKVRYSFMHLKETE